MTAQIIINLDKTLLCSLLQAEVAQFGAAEYATERKVPRKQAIEAVEYAINVLQLRLDAMIKSSDCATFIIDPDLLSKL